MAESKGVVYLLTHHDLAARLVVSAYSLRKWYDGPLTVFTTRNNAYKIGAAMAADEGLRAEHLTVPEVESEHYRLTAYLTKSAFIKYSPYSSTVFLDADTLVAGPIDALWQTVASEVVTVTQFGRWTTANDVYRETLPEWRSACERSRPDFLPLVDAAANVSHPLINTGVMRISATSSLLNDWHDLTMAGRTLALPDERAMQLLLFRYPHRLLGPQYNCIPTHCDIPEDVRIWHFAGQTHLQPQVGRQIWLPAYEECLQSNVAGIRDWSRIQRPTGPED